MIAYIDGILSKKQDCFLPSSLWFATEDCDDNTDISDTCLRLDGLHTEGKVWDDEHFTCRWKGVELCYIDESGEYVETEEFTPEEFQKIINFKDMRLVNMDVHTDTDLTVTITNFVLLEEETSLIELDTDLIDKIEVFAEE